MTDFGKTRSTVKPQEKVIDEYSVWLHTDIQEITVADCDGSEHIEYEYNMVQYTKDEYIKLIDEKNNELEQQLTDTQIGLVEVFEMIGG